MPFLPRSFLLLERLFLRHPCLGRSPDRSPVRNWAEELLHGARALLPDRSPSQRGQRRGAHQRWVHHERTVCGRWKRAMANGANVRGLLGSFSMLKSWCTENWSKCSILHVPSCASYGCPLQHEKLLKDGQVVSHPSESELGAVLSLCAVAVTAVTACGRVARDACRGVG